MNNLYAMRASAVARIGRDKLLIDNLEIRGVDKLDFHSCFVGALREALEDAWDAGLRAGRGGT